VGELLEPQALHVSAANDHRTSHHVSRRFIVATFG
jgi:hypothetical protein